MIGSQDYGAGSRAHGSEELKQAARDVADGVGQTITRTAQKSSDEIKHGVNRLIDQQKSALTTRLDDWATSARDAAGCVQHQHPQVAGLLDQAARRVQSATLYLRDHDLKDVLQEINRFGRQHPVILLGGMFVAGALAARFIKASQRPASGDGEGDHEAGAFGESHGEPPFVNRTPMSTAFSGSPVLSPSGTSPVQQSAGSSLRGGLEGCEP
jgi:hypothetical protein